MPLIKSISGVRGTIGGTVGSNLTPQDIVETTGAFGYWLLQKNAPAKVVIGRDARMSGHLLNGLVTNTLLALGIDVVDLGLSTTPTVEMAVKWENAGAGIILTASHNPKHWNALKFLNEKGEFISQADGQALLDMIQAGSVAFAEVNNLGSLSTNNEYIQQHIEAVLAHPLVDPELVAQQAFHVVVDAINSTGAISVPPLLKALGCKLTLINGEMTGDFAHNPEPLPAHLTQLCATITEVKADLGISVDPDVDRLAFVNEDGSLFGEEYTLVAVADYILQHQPGNTVSNLSSTRALRDITQKHGGTYFASAVGEVNVVSAMKAHHAVIGGEGNGGVIIPDLHYGRDALAGIALFLTHLAKSNMKMTTLRQQYPSYQMIKDRIDLKPDIDLDEILNHIASRYANEQVNTIDGVKIDFTDRWVHLRKSNTEPIIRLYAEAPTLKDAKSLVALVRNEVKPFL